MEVRIPCPCPPKADGAPRHDSDGVTLPDLLSFRTSLTVRQVIRFEVNAAAEAGEGLSLAEMTAVLVEAYVLHCIESWTLQDDGPKGKPEPIPLTKVNVRRYILANQETAEQIGNAADDLYTEKVVLPLVVPGSTSLPATPMPGSTSAKSGHGRNRTRSPRSSTTTTPMAGTTRMAASPGGGSNSSQR